jgi:hypothetical protein
VKGVAKTNVCCIFPQEIRPMTTALPTRWRKFLGGCALASDGLDGDTTTVWSNDTDMLINGKVPELHWVSGAPRPHLSFEVATSASAAGHGPGAGASSAPFRPMVQRMPSKAEAARGREVDVEPSSTSGGRAHLPTAAAIRAGLDVTLAELRCACNADAGQAIAHQFAVGFASAIMPAVFSPLLEEDGVNDKAAWFESVVTAVDSLLGCLDVIRVSLLLKRCCVTCVV